MPLLTASGLGMIGGRRWTEVPGSHRHFAGPGECGCRSSRASIPICWHGYAHRQHQVRRIGSVCAGAFVLAAAGVLDGRQATTHWELGRCFGAALSAHLRRWRPDFYPGRKRLDQRRGFCRHRSRAGDGRGRSRPRAGVGNRPPHGVVHASRRRPEPVQFATCSVRPPTINPSVNSSPGSQNISTLISRFRRWRVESE